MLEHHKMQGRKRATAQIRSPYSDSRLPVFPNTGRSPTRRLIAGLERAQSLKAGISALRPSLWRLATHKKAFRPWHHTRGWGHTGQTTITFPTIQSGLYRFGFCTLTRPTRPHHQQVTCEMYSQQPYAPEFTKSGALNWIPEHENPHYEHLYKPPTTDQQFQQPNMPP